MFLKVPDFKEPGLTRFLSDMDQRLQDERDTKLSKITANQSLLLQAQNGRVYSVTISDTGSLVVTLISSSPP